MSGGVDLISKREVPRFGIQNFEVTDIILGDPDSQLFEGASGSKILDLRNRRRSLCQRHHPIEPATPLIAHKRCTSPSDNTCWR